MMRSTAVRSLLFAAAGAVLSIGFLGNTRAVRADYPKPSVYPISWELKFDHGTAKRIVVDVPGAESPIAYWYITYTVTNNTDKDQTFLPVFELLTKDGQVIRSDKNIPQIVFDKIKGTEKNKFLTPFTEAAGVLRVGEAQAKESVAIWQEPAPRMGTFSIFVGGLSGEFVELKDEKGSIVKDADGKPVILRKALQLDYQVKGDEIAPQLDDVIELGSAYVMR